MAKKRIPVVRSVNIPEQRKEIERLISNNVGLVGYVANKLFRRYPWLRRLYQFDEAYCDGLQGLLRAAELYEEVRLVGGHKVTIPIKGCEYTILIESGLSKPTKFATYACIWIRQFILRAVDHIHLVRISTKTLKSKGKSRPAQIFLSDIKRINGNSDKNQFDLEDPHTREDHNIRYEVHQTVEKLIKSLPKNYAHVIRLRFYEGKTLEEIGTELNLTRERIRQIQVVAIGIMRNAARRLNLTCPV